jgi:hypothetical protein
MCYAMKLRARSLSAAVAWSLAACFQDFSTDPEPASRELEHVSPPSAEGPAGSIVTSPTVRLVERGSRKPIPDITVEFLLRPQSGSIANVVTRTDADGVASAGTWTLPVQAGQAVLDVQADGLRISFTATVKPGEPVALKVLDSTIAWIAGEPAPGPVVMVVDRFQNPIDGASVTFAVTHGGGQVASSETVTTKGGRASPGAWLLGVIPGENVLKATFADAPPLSFRTLGLDRRSFVWYELESVGGLPAPAGGIDKAKLGFTKFDLCLCAGETGYFVMEAMQSAGIAAPSLRVGMAGRYRIQSGQVQLIGDAGEIRASPEGETNTYLVRDQARSFVNGRFRVDVARWFPVPSVWSLLSWMFRETGS